MEWNDSDLQTQILEMLQTSLLSPNLNFHIHTGTPICSITIRAYMMIEGISYLTMASVLWVPVLLWFCCLRQGHKDGKKDGKDEKKDQ